jgi:hypothetical protein
VRRRGEEHPVAGLDRLQPQGHGQMRLADTRRSRHILPMNKVASEFTIPFTLE